MLRIRHEHASHEKSQSIPPWSKHLPRMPHSPQKLRRASQQQQTMQSRQMSNLQSSWSCPFELPFRVAFELRKNMKKPSNLFEHILTVLCLRCLRCLRLPPPGWPGTGHFSSAPCCHPGPGPGPGPATLEPSSESSRCIFAFRFGSFTIFLRFTWNIFTVLLHCAYHSPHRNKSKHRKINDFSKPLVLALCGTCLYSRDKSTNSRSCFGLKP